MPGCDGGVLLMDGEDFDKTINTSGNLWSLCGWILFVQRDSGKARWILFVQRESGKAPREHYVLDGGAAQVGWEPSGHVGDSVGGGLLQSQC